MAIAKINGRSFFLNCDSIEIDAVSAGRWDVTYDGRTFSIMGGLKSGGAANQWFVRHPLFFGDKWLSCKSMVEAVRTGVQH